MEQNHYTQMQLGKYGGDEDGEDNKGEVYSRFVTSSKEDILHVSLSDQVESESIKYHKLINEIRHPGSEVSAIVLYLGNYGGDIHSGLQIKNAMNASPVPVHCRVTAPSYSMGALLALCGDSLALEPDTFLMFHNYTAGFFGKGKELYDRAVFETEFYNKVLYNICSPFLTDKEIENLTKDHDIPGIRWDDPTLPARIKRHFKGRRS